MNDTAPPTADGAGGGVVAREIHVLTERAHLWQLIGTADALVAAVDDLQSLVRIAPAQATAYRSLVTLTAKLQTVPPHALPHGRFAAPHELLDLELDARTELLALTPGDHAGYVERAALLRTRGRLTDALRDIEVAVALLPPRARLSSAHRARPYYTRALIHFDLAHFDAALTDLERVLALTDDRNALFQKAVALQALGRPADALTAYGELIRRGGPRDTLLTADAHYNAAVLLELQHAAATLPVPPTETATATATATAAVPPTDPATAHAMLVEALKHYQHAQALYGAEHPDSVRRCAERVAVVSVRLTAMPTPPAPPAAGTATASGSTPAPGASARRSRSRSRSTRRRRASRSRSRTRRHSASRSRSRSRLRRQSGCDSAAKNEVAPIPTRPPTPAIPPPPSQPVPQPPETEQLRTLQTQCAEAARADDWAQTERLASEWLAVHSSGNAYEYRASARQKLGRVSEAAADYHAALALTADGRRRTALLMGLARAHQSVGSFDAAFNAVNAVLDGRPKDPPALLFRAALYASAPAPHASDDLALRDLNRLPHDHSQGHWERALVLLRRTRFGDAKDAFDRSLACFAGRTDARQYLATALLREAQGVDVLRKLTAPTALLLTNGGQPQPQPQPPQPPQTPTKYLALTASAAATAADGSAASASASAASASAPAASGSAAAPLPAVPTLDRDLLAAANDRFKECLSDLRKGIRGAEYGDESQFRAATQRLTRSSEQISALLTALAPPTYSAAASSTAAPLTRTQSGSTPTTPAATGSASAATKQSPSTNSTKATPPKPSSARTAGVHHPEHHRRRSSRSRSRSRGRARRSRSRSRGRDRSRDHRPGSRNHRRSRSRSRSRGGRTSNGGSRPGSRTGSRASTPAPNASSASSSTASASASSSSGTLTRSASISSAIGSLAVAVDSAAAAAAPAIEVPVLVSPLVIDPKRSRRVVTPNPRNTPTPK